MRKLLSITIEAAVLAGGEIMKVYDKDFEVQLKSDSSPITVADKNANKIINFFLEKTAIPIISEENEQLDFEKRKNWDTCWMVDPLDGTKEFVKRNGEFTVNIALIEKNKPILGVIYVPVTKTLYYGIVAEGKAYKIVLNSHKYSNEIIDKSIEIKPANNSKDTIKIVGSRSHKSKETSKYMHDLEKQGNKIELISVGSSLKFCTVAEGNATLYPRFAPTMEWDTAAGHAICNAVGLSVKQTDSNEELKYNKSNLLNPFFIVN